MREGKNRSLIKEGETSKKGIIIKKDPSFKMAQEKIWERVITNGLRSQLPFIPRTHLSFCFRNWPYKKLLLDLDSRGLLNDYRKLNRIKSFFQSAEKRCREEPYTDTMFNIAIPYGKSKDFKKNEKLFCDAYIAWTDDKFSNVEYESLAKLSVIMNGEGSFNGYTHYQIPMKRKNFTKCFFLLSGKSENVTYHPTGRNGRNSLYIPSPRNENFDVQLEVKIKSRKRKYRELANVSQSPPPTPESMDLEIDNMLYFGLVQIGEYYKNEYGEYVYHNKLNGKGLQLLSPSHLQEYDYNIAPITKLTANDLEVLGKKIKKAAVKETLPYLMLEFEIEEVKNLLEKTLLEQKKMIGSYEIQECIRIRTQMEYRLEWKPNDPPRVFRTLKCIGCNSTFDNVRNLIIHLNTHYLSFAFTAVINHLLIIINVSFKGLPQDKNLKSIEYNRNYNSSIRMIKRNDKPNRRFPDVPKKMKPKVTILFMGGKRMREYISEKYYNPKLSYDYTETFSKDSSESETSDDVLLALPFPKTCPDFATKTNNTQLLGDWDQNTVVRNPYLDYPFATPNYYTDRNMIEGNYFIELPSENFHSVRLERRILKTKCDKTEKIYCLLWDKFVYENNIGTPILPHENMCKALIQFYLNYIFEHDERYQLHQYFLTHGNILSSNNYITVEERSKVFRFCSLDFINIEDYEDIEFDKL
uniref:C2H2-type domain-containing protein n=1 Tax=Parastrongyloides trichosuri TaxID=131310 RepID=A0A0N4ZMB8_PARTI